LPPAMRSALGGSLGLASTRLALRNGPANEGRMSLPMKSLEILPWPLIHFSFSRTARRSVPAVAYFSDSLSDVGLKNHGVDDAWRSFIWGSRSLGMALGDCGCRPSRIRRGRFFCARPSSQSVVREGDFVIHRQLIFTLYRMEAPLRQRALTQLAVLCLPEDGHHSQVNCENRHGMAALGGHLVPNVESLCHGARFSDQD
jgi:hypothetical protein